MFLNLYLYAFSSIQLSIFAKLFVFIISINLKINDTLQILIQCKENIQSYLAAVMVSLVLIKDG